MKPLDRIEKGLKRWLLFLAVLAVLSGGHGIVPAAEEAKAQGKSSPAAAKAAESNTPDPAVPPPVGMGMDRPALPAQEPSAGPWPKLGRSPGCRTLLIHLTPKDPRVMAEIEEDLNVMARILEKGVEQQVKSTPVKKLGVVLQSMGQERPQAIYLDGYGALFVLHVRVPLVPTRPAEKAEAGAAPRQLPWDQARQELYGSESGRGESMPGAEPPAAYDERLVASLKQQLLAALENATHLRHLKPDEYVTVTLLGTSGPQSASRPSPATLTSPVDQPVEGAGGARGGAAGGAGFGGGSFGGSFFSSGSFSGRSSGTFRGAAFGGGGFGSPEPGSRVGTTLTLRIKKSDADGLAAGKLSAEEFQKKAVVQAYEGNAPEGGADFFSWGGGF